MTAFPNRFSARLHPIISTDPQGVEHVSFQDTIRTKEDLYELAQTIADQLTKSKVYENKLARLCMTNEDIASECAINFKQTWPVNCRPAQLRKGATKAQKELYKHTRQQLSYQLLPTQEQLNATQGLPIATWLSISTPVAWYELQCDIENKLVPRAKDRKITSYDAPVVDPEGNETTVLERIQEDPKHTAPVIQVTFPDKQILAAVDALPAKLAQIIRMRYFGESTVREAAAELKMAKSTFMDMEIEALRKMAIHVAGQAA